MKQFVGLVCFVMTFTLITLVSQQGENLSEKLDTLGQKILSDEPKFVNASEDFKRKHFTNYEFDK